jgi:hypothetical protein
VESSEVLVGARALGDLVYALVLVVELVVLPLVLAQVLVVYALVLVVEVVVLSLVCVLVA